MLITTNWLVDLLIVSVLTFIIAYKYATRNFNYWKKKGVPFVKPLPFVGNFLDIFLFRTTIGHLLAKFYNSSTSPILGLFIYGQPYLLIRDPELVKAVLVKDFSYFQDRLILSNEKDDPISAKTLFVVKNPEWKAMRVKMSPAFSSGKIKNMFALMNDVGADLKKYLRKHSSERVSIEAKEVCAKFSTDVITSCAFGINGHSFEREDAEFRVVGRRLFDFRWSTAIQQATYFLAPAMAKLFKMKLFDSQVTDFLRDVLWRTVKQREKDNLKRNDVIDIIVQLRKNPAVLEGIKFEGDRVVAQAVQFFAAGFETTSSVMAFTLYELCLNPHIQDKVRAEIKACVSKHDGVTYDGVQEMKYLHMVVSETLRKYPVLPFLDRVCLQDYTIPNTNIVIEKGTPIHIPMFGLHYDPKYFPEPDKYDPERFSDENKHSIPPFAYIPFGEGPRICIGERFGLLGTKLGLIHMLLEFEVKRAVDTPVPLQFEPKSLVLASPVGLPMLFVRVTSAAA